MPLLFSQTNIDMKRIKSVAAILALSLASSLFAQHHPQSVSPFSESLTEAYLAIHSALAQDDLAAVHDAALFYIAAFDKTNADLNTENLTRYADQIASSQDLQAARVSFKALSEQAKLLFDYLAANSSQPLYLVRCGMAFGGQGAEWIQSTQEVANPYYGTKMQKCGSVLRSIGSFDTPITSSSSECNHDDASESCGHSNTGSCCSK